MSKFYDEFIRIMHDSVLTEDLKISRLNEILRKTDRNSMENFDCQFMISFAKICKSLGIEINSKTMQLLRKCSKAVLNTRNKEQSGKDVNVENPMLNMFLASFHGKFQSHKNLCDADVLKMPSALIYYYTYPVETDEKTQKPSKRRKVEVSEIRSRGLKFNHLIDPQVWCIVAIYLLARFSLEIVQSIWEEHGDESKGINMGDLVRRLRKAVSFFCFDQLDVNGSRIRACLSCCALDIMASGNFNSVAICPFMVSHYLKSSCVIKALKLPLQYQGMHEHTAHMKILDIAFTCFLRKHSHVYGESQNKSAFIRAASDLFQSLRIKLELQDYLSRESNGNILSVLDPVFTFIEVQLLIPGTLSDYDATDIVKMIEKFWNFNTSDEDSTHPAVDGWEIIFRSLYQRKLLKKGLQGLDMSDIGNESFINFVIELISEAIRRDETCAQSAINELREWVIAFYVARTDCGTAIDKTNLAVSEAIAGSGKDIVYEKLTVKKGSYPEETALKLFIQPKSEMVQNVNRQVNSRAKESSIEFMNSEISQVDSSNTSRDLILKRKKIYEGNMTSVSSRKQVNQLTHGSYKRDAENVNSTLTHRGISENASSIQIDTNSHRKLIEGKPNLIDSTVGNGVTEVEESKFDHGEIERNHDEVMEDVEAEIEGEVMDEVDESLEDVEDGHDIDDDDTDGNLGMLKKESAIEIDDDVNSYDRGSVEDENDLDDKCDVEDDETQEGNTSKAYDQNIERERYHDASGLSSDNDSTGEDEEGTIESCNACDDQECDEIKENDDPSSCVDVEDDSNEELEDHIVKKEEIMHVANEVLNENAEKLQVNEVLQDPRNENENVNIHLETKKDTEEVDEDKSSVEDEKYNDTDVLIKNANMTRDNMDLTDKKNKISVNAEKEIADKLSVNGKGSVSTKQINVGKNETNDFNNGSDEKEKAWENQSIYMCENNFQKNSGQDSFNNSEKKRCLREAECSKNEQSKDDMKSEVGPGAGEGKSEEEVAYEADVDTAETKMTVFSKKPLSALLEKHAKDNNVLQGSLNDSIGTVHKEEKEELSKDFEPTDDGKSMHQEDEGAYEGDADTVELKRQSSEEDFSKIDTSTKMEAKLKRTNNSEQHISEGPAINSVGEALVTMASTGSNPTCQIDEGDYEADAEVATATNKINEESSSKTCVPPAKVKEVCEEEKAYEADIEMEIKDTSPAFDGVKDHSTFTSAVGDNQSEGGDIIKNGITETNSNFTEYVNTTSEAISSTPKICNGDGSSMNATEANEAESKIEKKLDESKENAASSNCDNGNSVSLMKPDTLEFKNKGNNELTLSLEKGASSDQLDRTGNLDSDCVALSEAKKIKNQLPPLHPSKSSSVVSMKKSSMPLNIDHNIKKQETEENQLGNPERTEATIENNNETASQSSLQLPVSRQYTNRSASKRKMKISTTQDGEELSVNTSDPVEDGSKSKVTQKESYEKISSTGSLKSEKSSSSKNLVKKKLTKQLKKKSAPPSPATSHKYATRSASKRSMVPASKEPSPGRSVTSRQYSTRSASKRKEQNNANDIDNSSLDSTIKSVRSQKGPKKPRKKEVIEIENITFPKQELLSVRGDDMSFQSADNSKSLEKSKQPRRSTRSRSSRKK